MIQINSKADLNRAVAEHCMGWVWQSNITHGYTILLPPDWRQMSNGVKHWIFCPTVGDMNLTVGVFEAEQTCFPRKECSVPDFCGDPVASYMLRQKMRASGHRVHIVDLANHPTTGVQVLKSKPARLVAAEDHKDELIAMCLAALRALGVEFQLVEGWDK